MAWTQSDVDALKKAIAAGTKRVIFADGREVMYQDANFMLQALSQMQAEVNQSSGAAKISYASFCKG